MRTSTLLLTCLGNAVAADGGAGASPNTNLNLGGSGGGGGRAVQRPLDG